MSRAVDFYNACRNGDLRLVKAFLQKGFDAYESRTYNGRTGYHTACKYGYSLTYSLTFLLTHSFNSAKEDILQLLIEYSPSLIYAVDKDGNMGFHDACKHAHVNIVRAHMNMNFDIHIANKIGITGMCLLTLFCSLVYLLTRSFTHLLIRAQVGTMHVVKVI